MHGVGSELSEQDLTLLNSKIDKRNQLGKSPMVASDKYDNKGNRIGAELKFTLFRDSTSVKVATIVGPGGCQIIGQTETYNHFLPVQITSLALLMVFYNHGRDDGKIPSPDKAMRRAAALNMHEHLNLLLKIFNEHDFINRADQTPGGPGSTALHWAVEKGSKECQEVLLRHGARTDIPNNAGKTVDHLLRDLAATEGVYATATSVRSSRPEAEAAPAPSSSK